MPAPSPSEPHDDFIDRCIPIVLADGAAKTPKQAVAVCESLWKKESKMAKNDIERRCVALDDVELRVEPEGEDGYRITGQAALFRQRSPDLGGFVEEIEPGFFKDVLQGDTRFLLNHDANFVLGRVPAGTLSLKETGSALEIDGHIAKTSRNEDWIIDPMRRRDITGMSFGFRVAKGGDEWTELDGGLMLRKLLPGGCSELPDVSVVTFPAYPKTSAAVRSLELWRAEHPEPRSRRNEILVRARALQLRS